MPYDWRATLQDEIPIDVSKAVEAYEVFTSLHRVSRRKSDESNGSAVYEFEKLIRDYLDKMNIPLLRKETFLAAKQTYSHWRTSSPKPEVTRRKCVVLAVLRLTGIDISLNNLIARSPVNFSDIVELGSLVAKKITNDPNEIVRVVYDVELSNILFKAHSCRVLSTWLELDDRYSKRKNSQEHEPVDIGLVRFGLSEAEIGIEHEPVIEVSRTTRLSPENSELPTRIEGCVVLWSDTRCRWLVQPTETGIMQARIEKVPLCRVSTQRGTLLSVLVAASPSQFIAEFKVSPLDTKDRKSTNADALARARERLFSIVLAHRHREGAILSIQRYKMP
jgi:hypothetical protein